jgi:hypothetical protein
MYKGCCEYEERLGGGRVRWWRVKRKYNNEN